MLTSWICQSCDKINDTTNSQCIQCNEYQTSFSPIDQIMSDQQLLFDGFMRIKILNNLSNHAKKIMCDDIIDLAQKFHTIPIVSLMKESTETLLEHDKHAWMNYRRRYIFRAVVIFAIAFKRENNIRELFNQTSKVVGFMSIIFTSF